MSKYSLTDGTKELLSQVHSQVSLYMTVRADELMSEYDISAIDAQEMAMTEVKDLAQGIFLGMED